MPYKTITTFLPKPERATPLLDVVLPIIRENGAHHIGLHVVPRVFTIYGGAEYQVPVDVIERQEKALQAKAKDIEKVFKEHAAGSEVSSEWRCVEAAHGDLAYDIIDQAVCADMVVIGLETKAGSRAWTDLPADIAIRTGRPVLTVPNAGDIDTIGKRVTVAWNNSREAARAAFDAVPFLINAEAVKVLAIQPKDARDRNANGEELALALRRHGVKAEAITVREAKVSAGKEILARLGEDKSDLLVMGCYGHSRFRESLLGGATRELLRRMSVPVLFSH